MACLYYTVSGLNNYICRYFPPHTYCRVNIRNGIFCYEKKHHPLINLGSFVPGGSKRLNPSGKCGVWVIYFFMRMNQKSAPLIEETLCIFICCARFLNTNGWRYRQGRDLARKASRRRIRRLPRVLGGVGARIPKVWANARTCPVHAVLACV